MKKLDTKKLIFASAVGALYAVLTVLPAPLSYGPLQLRISEALCVLPFYLPYTAWGLFVGCALANVLSAAGILDVIFGSLATLISCLLMSAVGKKGMTLKHRLTALFVPVLVNGLIVGATLTIAVGGLDPVKNIGAFLVYAGQVALGEAAVMYALGLPLMLRLNKLIGEAPAAR